MSRLKIIIPLPFKLLVLALVLLKCSSEQKKLNSGRSLVWSDQFMGLVNDSVKVNPLVDSLKKDFLSSKTDTGAIKTVIELSFRWLSKSSLFIAEEAYNQSKKIGYAAGECEALCRMGTAAHRMGKTPESFDYFKESLRIADEHNLKRLKAQTLAFNGNLLQGMQTHGKAYKNFQEALDLSREVGDYNTIAL